MNDAPRADPDALLSAVQAEERAARRGKLKIFFGASAGVGKTYAMLDAARRQRAAGGDVVIGYVEPHGRIETERLLDGMEQLPLRRVQTGAVTLAEFDLDAALTRRPGLLIVDELAHTNAPGARHAKRWQDIEELRIARIDVWTTVNVQHIDSLNDLVAEITTVRTQETIPDTVFESADEVELIDLPPDELLQRLRDGKVYVPEQVRVALDHFFKKSNLIALRELALRKTAERVDATMDRYRATAGIGAPGAGERLLVGIGPRSDGELLVRAGKRLAAALHAPWIVAYVETPSLIRMPEAQRNRRIDWLRLAEELGAEAVTLGGPSASTELVGYAKTRNVSRLLLGRTTRRGWRGRLLGVLRPSTIERVLARAEGFDVTVVQTSEPMRLAKNPVLARSAAYFGVSTPAKRRWPSYLWSLAAVALATVIAWVISPALNEPNVVMIYLLGIALTALEFGRGPAVLASLASTAAYNFFFVEPLYSFDVSDGQYFLTFAVLMSVGLIIGNLVASVRLQARVAGYRERRTALLYAMSRELAGARGFENMARIAIRHISEAFDAQLTVLLPDATGTLRHPTGQPEPVSLHAADLSVAQWVYSHRQSAGLGTHTLPAAPVRYLPLIASEAARPALGVLAVLPANARRVLLPEQAHLLDTFAAQVALALERAALADAAQSAAVAAEAESVRNSLLAAISHDMRTPLAVISGAATVLADEQHRLDASEQRQMARAIADESQRMTRLIGNVLEMTRLDTGAAPHRFEWVALDELVAGALRNTREQLRRHHVLIRHDDDLPLVRGDAVLLEQLLVNLLENAARHTPAGTQVCLTTRARGERVEIEVADDGPGFAPTEDPERLFGKFERGSSGERGHERLGAGGVGLGLAICRAIARVHDGEIHAHRGTRGGAVFVVSLPMPDESPPMPPEESGP